jgi:capsular polysaccharide transport system ATP-binding protein
MPARPGTRVIHLLAVAKSFFAAGSAPKLVFRPTTLSFPADRRVAVLGDRRDGKTVLLQLLAGLEVPDEGAVIAPLRLSPIVNGGRLFHPNLTGLENIRFHARLSGIDADHLLAAVSALSGVGKALNRPVRDLEWGERKSVEAALTAALPFDCHLIDDLGQLEDELAEQYFAAAAQQRAGVIFATNKARLARRFADCAVVIRDQTLYPFARVEEATSFYER